jgi:hypothetical protein
MALLQALFAFISRSASRILNALFGWSVLALFGRAPKREQALLTALVAAAAAWPLLLIGVAFPRIATFLFAFVPLSDRVPSWAARLVWIALALVVPIAVGFTIAARARDRETSLADESLLKRVLRGFPITLGIACAFLVTVVTVPVLRVFSAVRRRADEHIPYVTTGEQYAEAAARIEEVARVNAFGVVRAKPPWWLVAPSRIMQKLGGAALRGFVPRELAYWKSDALEIALQPNDIVVRGEIEDNAWAHGVLAEALARGPGKQTFEAQAQDLEAQLQQVWAVLDEEPIAHRDSRRLLARVDEIARELAHLAVDYEQWQIVYRELTQLRAALHGERQLLERA